MKTMDENILITQPKREVPRIPFGQLIERGLIKPGAVLTDSQNRYKAKVHADGSVIAQNRIDPLRGSIHKVGAALQDAPSCNGWTFWHFEEKGKTLPIDALRERLRIESNG